MMESMTQLMFKGYEEARVALSTLLFTAPCCVIIGVEYGLFEKGTLAALLKVRTTAGSDLTPGQGARVQGGTRTCLCSMLTRACLRSHSHDRACKQDPRDINILHSYMDQLYAAVCFSVLNTLEKVLRCADGRLLINSSSAQMWP